MTFEELCLNPPHSGTGGWRRTDRHVPWAVLVLTRLGKVWRFYMAHNYDEAWKKGNNPEDSLEVLRIVPISKDQYKLGVYNTRRLNNKAHRNRLKYC